MPALTEAGWHLIAMARAKKYCDEVDKKTTIVLLCVGAYCVLKMFCIPMMLLAELDAQIPVWEAHLQNTSAATCQRCLDEAIEQKVPADVRVEMTHCFDTHGHVINITRPHEATLGSSREVWARTWDEFGDDWWDRHPLDKAAVQFDSRWFFPNARHHQMLRIGKWWPDQLVTCFLVGIGVFCLVLVTVGLTATRMAVAITSLVIAAFTPFFAFRLGQNYGWEVVGPASGGCAYVYFRSDQFTSFCFWMLVTWYASMVMFFVPCVTKSAKDTVTEGNAATILEAVLAIVAWICGMIFISALKHLGPASSWDVLQVWTVILIYGVFDCLALAFLLWVLFRVMGLKEIHDDKVTPF